MTARTAVVITRNIYRPWYSELMRTLNDLGFQVANADMYMAVTGRAIGIHYDRTNTFAPYANKPILMSDVGNSAGRITRLIYCVLAKLSSSQYEEVIFLDDDAYFIDPAEAIAQIQDAFDAYPWLATTGPMGSLRKFQKYTSCGKLIKQVNNIARTQWAPLGCQAYRMSAIRNISLSWLLELEFRADVPLAMILYGNGYMVAEQDIRFQHKLSSGLNQPAYSKEFWEFKIRCSNHDWESFGNNFHQYVDVSFIPELEYEISKASKSELAFYKKRYAQFLKSQETNSCQVAPQP